ncbi:hypothetical protein MKW11_10495 [Gluconobacter frateurii]|uniref:hypothetical protein n=1 Tax=Gluconobacter frateurii TaxID=38308 RepID=UPI001F0701BE|nr:hypothetical protein [Gluconobacter frateurii]UMM07644.1 hypothetical protein MKW11_10495 [Gluconobacter frateurii]
MKPMMVLCLLMAGCSSVSKGPDPDQAYENAMETGRSAFDLGHPDQSESQYRTAMDRALIRDDAPQIHDAGFNLATALLEENKPADALTALDRTERALKLRQYSQTSDLELVRSAALYRQHDLTGSEAFALTALQSPDVQVRNRAAYLVGLGAADQGDTTQLARMETVLAPSKEPAAMMDHQDLAARLTLLNHAPALAFGQAMSLTQKRRDAQDYEGMRRALLVAAQAAEAQGDMSTAAALRQQELSSRSVQETGHVEKASITVSTVSTPATPIR